MVVSLIKTENYNYYNFHAEQVMLANYFTDNSEQGIYEDLLISDTVEKIFTDVKTNVNKNIVLDFANIENVSQNNINKKFYELKDLGFNIVLLNIKKNIVDALGFTAISHIKNEETQDAFRKYHLFTSNMESLDGKIELRKIFQAEFEKQIDKYIEQYEKPHTSSYVYLHSYVDLKNFISNEKQLFLFSMYRLAMAIKYECAENLKDNPILICQSLNSSLIASILSHLLKFDILILDKIGPINKLYSRLDTKIKDKKYIIISDLVCLGTEVKIVKNLIQFLGGTYVRNASLIKIETLNVNHIKKEDATIGVFSINRGNNAKLRYKITTNLEDFK